MARSISETMEELREELANARQRIERLRAKDQPDELSRLERWIEDAEKVLARWDQAATS